MTYRPAETSFAPPFVVLVPSFIYLSLALVAIGVVIAAHVGPTNSNLHIWIVEQDPRRVIGSRTFATLIAASALSVLLRASMRGVRIRPDGIEYRDVLLGWPRIRRYRWPQIDRIILDQPRSIVLDLWDGTHACGVLTVSTVVVFVVSLLAGCSFFSQPAKNTAVPMNSTTNNLRTFAENIYPPEMMIDF